MPYGFANVKQLSCLDLRLHPLIVNLFFLHFLNLKSSIGNRKFYFLPAFLHRQIFRFFIRAFRAEFGAFGFIIKSGRSAAKHAERFNLPRRSSLRSRKMRDLAHRSWAKRSPDYSGSDLTQLCSFFPSCKAKYNCLPDLRSVVSLFKVVFGLSTNITSPIIGRGRAQPGWG